MDDRESLRDWDLARLTVRKAMQKMLCEQGVPESLAHRVTTRGRANRGAMALLLAGDSGHARITSSIDVAASLELMHQSSVIRDDIEDSDSVRRGAPTAHALDGVAAALALSDVLLSTALESIAASGLEIESKVLGAFARMALGQLADVHPSVVVDRAAPFRPAEYKTGTLLGLVFYVGGVCSERCNSDVTVLEAVGVDLGTAFQLANDIHNATRDEGRGRPIWSDREMGRRSSVLVLARDQAADDFIPSDDRVRVACEAVTAEINRRLERAEQLSKRLERPLPRPLESLVLDRDAAVRFVGDQQGDRP